MSQPTIAIKPREVSQKLSSLRSKDIIPGIMYGQSLKTSVPIQIKLKDLQSILSDTSKTIFNLEFDGEMHECILRDYQTNRMSTEILHVDFQYVKRNETIKMQIPMAYEGIERLRSKKLVLETFLSKVPVKGKVENLPDVFTVDISTFNKSDKIVAKSLNLPDKTELLLHPETIIATVQ